MKNLFFGVIERLWIGAVLLYQVFIAIPFVFWETFVRLFRAAKVLLRFFIVAPFLQRG